MSFSTKKKRALTKTKYKKRCYLFIPALLYLKRIANFYSVNLQNSIKMKKLKKVAFAMSVVLCSVAYLSPVFGQDAPKLTDPEIASVAVVANQNDIDFAEIAKQKSHDKKVLEFANTMITDHKSVIDLAVALVTKLHVTPKDNAVSKQLLSDAANTKKMLNSKSAKEFNKAYVDNEVAYHKAVISAVKTILIPQSQNAELKALLEKVVPILEAHLAHAEMVQKEI